jgi:two-component system chemotaxis response regulator CheY
MKEPQLPRILIVDDEPFMRTTVKAMLRLVGKFAMQDAWDGDSALEKVDAFRPDIIICDVGMVPTGGVEFVEKLHIHPDPAMREIPIIMLTADRNEETVLTAARLRLAGYLVKPVAARQLGNLLRAILSRREAVVRQGLGPVHPDHAG